MERDPKSIKRLVAALEYKSGLSPAKIQHKYGWHEQTVYDWLDIVAEREGAGSPAVSMWSFTVFASKTNTATAKPKTDSST